MQDMKPLKSWQEVADEKCIPQYQAFEITEEERSKKVEKDTFLLDIGTENCQTNSYCNGPLKPGSSFGINMRILTKQGFSDTNYIRFKTSSEVPLLLISILALSLMCIVFVIGFFITYKRTKSIQLVEFELNSKVIF